jgi:hypothetical protein
MKCSHQNVEIIEHGTMYTSHTKDNYGNWEEWQDVGNYSDKITINVLIVIIIEKLVGVVNTFQSGLKIILLI